MAATPPRRKPPPAELLGAWLEDFGRARPTFNEAAGVMRALLAAASTSLGIDALIAARVKTPWSFARKAAAAWAELRSDDDRAAFNPVRCFTDLAAARAVTLLRRDAEAIAAWVQAHLRIDAARSGDRSARLGPHEFGYRSLHYIVRVDPARLPAGWAGVAGDASIPAPVVTPDAIERIAGVDVEVQLRTRAEHIWADLDHDRVYKGSFRLPREHQRSNARIAALLENVDAALEDLVREIDVLETNAGAYRSPAEMDHAIAEARLVLGVGVAPGDADDHAVRAERSRARALLARALVSRGTADALREAITVAEAGDDGAGGDEIRSLAAQARCALAAMTGDAGLDLQPAREQLLRLARTPPVGVNRRTVVEAATALAESYEDAGDTTLAADAFDLAFRADPSDPRVLTGYLRGRLLAGDAGAMGLLLPQLVRESIERCAAQVAARVNIPHALLVGAELSMLTHDPDAYCAGDRSPVLRALADLCRGLAVPGFEAAGLDRVAKRFVGLVGSGLGARPWIRWGMAVCDLARAAHDQARAAGPRAATRVARPAVTGGAFRRRLDRAESVLIIAGGCDGDDSTPQRAARTQRLIETVLRTHRGPVFCGGTTSGISGIAARAHAAAGAAEPLLAYAPLVVPDSAQLDRDAYVIAQHDGDGAGFSPWEPILTWLDILDAGVPARRVRLLGVGGGDIAAFEYHLAALLGADVAIVSRSGRAADRLEARESEPGNERFCFLPPDAEALRAWAAGPARRPDDLTHDARLEFDLLQRIEARYHESIAAGRVAQFENAKASDSDLAEVFGRSNIEQLWDIDRKLALVGLRRVARADADRLGLDTRRGAEVFHASIERLAEVEHGRWLVERARAGWRLGDRDDAARRRPTMVPWEQLTDEGERDKDRAAVSIIPELVERMGCVIVPDPR